MGIVYLAVDTRLGRTVALKAVPPQLAGDPIRAERLRREARATAALNHPGIATVYSLDEIDGHLYLASEYVAGDNLREVLARGPLGVERTIAVGRELTRALAAAHARGVVHRDLKPENLVLTDSGQVKILDFGLAHMLEDSERAPLTRTGAALGTPSYMSPEQIRGAPVDPRSDLFSLGVVIYELATGTHPFRTETTPSAIASVLEDQPEPLTTRLPASKMSPAAYILERIVTTALAKTPDARYQTAADMAAALDSASVDTRSPHAGASLRPASHSSRRPSARWWWQFHQAATTVAYLLLLLPVWHTRGNWTHPDLAMGMFLAGVVAVVVAGALRLHLWFASLNYEEEWAEQHRRTRFWIRLSDLLFSIVLLASGVTAIRAEAPAVLLVAAAASVAVSSVVIEPATTRAAFREDSSL
jgi:serine/threonine protein kinase